MSYVSYFCCLCYVVFNSVLKCCTNLHKKNVFRAFLSYIFGSSESWSDKVKLLCNKSYGEIERKVLNAKARMWWWFKKATEMIRTDSWYLIGIHALCIKLANNLCCFKHRRCFGNFFRFVLIILNYLLFSVWYLFRS